MTADGYLMHKDINVTSISKRDHYICFFVLNPPECQWCHIAPDTESFLDCFIYISSSHLWSVIQNPSRQTKHTIYC